jgi:hypothetical protein
MLLGDETPVGGAESHGSFGINLTERDVVRAIGENGSSAGGPGFPAAAVRSVSLADRHA